VKAGARKTGLPKAGLPKAGLAKKAAPGSQSVVSGRPITAILLVGFMGAGKSTVGRALGNQLGWPFEDLDERIERREQRKVQEIFRDSGETGFRRAEHAVLADLLVELRGGVEKIVALGGGAFAQERNTRLIRAANVPTIFLHAPVEELWRRCHQQAGQPGMGQPGMGQPGMERPLLGSLATFSALYETRLPHYSEAWFRHETSGKKIEDIAAEIVQALNLNRSQGKRGKT